MSNLDITATVEECKTLYRTGVVTNVRSNYNLDITIEGEAYEDVSIHYHCEPIWGSESHPHNEQEMAVAFEVDDEVIVLCNEDGEPLYVVGFTEQPRLCEPVIVLRKLIGEIWDYWYFIVSLGEGYNRNPGGTEPSTPPIITTWWSCEGLQEVLYYSVATPTLSLLTSGGCGDVCGLLTFTEGACCDAPENGDPQQEVWYGLPCGGTAIETVRGWVGEHVLDCAMCGDGQETVYMPAVRNVQNRANRQTVACQEGSSWTFSYGALNSAMAVGARVGRESGTESSTVGYLEESDCGPYEKHWFQCYAGWNEETCECGNPMGWLPIHLYQVCESSLDCYGYHGEFGRSKHFRGPDTYGKWWGESYQGCALYDVTTRQAGSYATESVPLALTLTAGEIQTIFSGSWFETYRAESTETVNNVQRGWSTNCIECPEGSGIEPGVTTVRFAYSEESYGIGGWSTVVTSDNRLAVLIPHVTASASAVSTNGSATGTIISTTTMLLRIVDEEEENDYEIASEGMSDSLSSVPTGRADLRIKPECYAARDIPLDYTIRGFHWFEATNWVFTAFDLEGDFHSGLVRKEDGEWTEVDMSVFEAFVLANGLEEYTMYLTRARGD